MNLPRKTRPRPADPARDRLTVSKNGIEGVGRAVDAAFRLTVLKYALAFAGTMIPIVVWVLFRR